MLFMKSKIHLLELFFSCRIVNTDLDTILYFVSSNNYNIYNHSYDSFFCFYIRKPYIYTSKGIHVGSTFKELS